MGPYPSGRALILNLTTRIKCRGSGEVVALAPGAQASRLRGTNRREWVYDRYHDLAGSEAGLPWKQKTSGSNPPTHLTNFLYWDVELES